MFCLTAAMLAPTTLVISLPFLMKTKVGMAEISYLWANSGNWSTSTFKKVAPSAYCSENFSTIGAIILHGPHHVAKKSTTISLSVLEIEESNSATEVIGVTIFICVFVV